MAKMLPGPITFLFVWIHEEKNTVRKKYILRTCYFLDALQGPLQPVTHLILARCGTEVSLPPGVWQVGDKNLNLKKNCKIF